MAPSRTAKSASAQPELPFGKTKSSAKSAKSHKTKSISPVTSRDDLPRPAPLKASQAGASLYPKLLKQSKKQMGFPMVQKDTLNWSEEQIILHIWDSGQSQPRSPSSPRGG